MLTIDLFLDLAPFTTRTSNQYGCNVDICSLLAIAPFEIEIGDRSELNGFSEFDHDRIHSGQPRGIASASAIQR